MKLDKVLTIVLWVLLAVSAVLVISMMTNISENDADPTMGAWINTNLTWSYILLGASAVIAVVFALFNTFTDKAAAKKGLIALVFAGVILAISYALASDAIPQFHGVQKFVADGTLDTSISKWIGTTLYATYILLFLAVISIAGFAVTRIFK
jgi:small-conductance mechanosensitive channel